MMNDKTIASKMIAEGDRWALSDRGGALLRDALEALEFYAKVCRDIDSQEEWAQAANDLIADAGERANCVLCKAQEESKTGSSIPPSPQQEK